MCLYDSERPAVAAVLPTGRDARSCVVPLIEVFARPEADTGLLAAHVEGLNCDRLVELILEAADQDWRLRERLLAEARAARGQGPDLAMWRRRVEDGFHRAAATYAAADDPQ
jgi:hypothetical protein